MPNPPKLSYVSLFTGAGGLDIGLEATGRFDLLACVEIEGVFCESLVANRDEGNLGSSKTQIIKADIAKLDPRELMERLKIAPGDLDVLVGGPPCQTWSTAGKRETVRDPRGQLIWDFLRFVEVLQPKAFLMENVRGLLSGALRHRPLAERPALGGVALQADELPGSAVEAWAADASRVVGGRYRVDAFEVNAANYGAPQIRERVLFFGTAKGTSVDFPQPTHGVPGSGLEAFATLRDAIGAIREKDPVLTDFSPRKKAYLQLIPEGGNWRALPPKLAEESMGRAFFAKGGRSGWWRRLSWDLPSPTITTLPNHSSTSLCHPTETRVISVREAAAVQEFPPTWTFKGTPQEQMRQIGNAVPARLGRVAGEVLSRHFDSEQSPVCSLPAFRRVYLNSHIRTRQWWKNGQAFVRTAGVDEAYEARTTV
jgi:DNA (cytosine-5)-methyltransferase 1